MGFLYIIRNSVNSKVYVGITTGTVEHRWSQHKHDSKKGVRNKLYNALRKHGVEVFRLEVLAEYETWEELTAAEVAKIAELGSKLHGYNSTDGGEGQYGRRLSDESRQRISEKLRGIKLSPEHAAKAAQARIGLKRGPHSAQAKLNMSAGLKPKEYDYQGRKQSLLLWITELGLTLSVPTLQARIDRQGWRIEKAFFTPLDPPKQNVKQYTFRGKTQSLGPWAKETGISINVLNSRLQNGWSLERTFLTPVAFKKKAIHE